MIEFHSPYLIPIIFLFLVFCVAFAIGNVWAEITTGPDKPDASPVRWFLLIVPSLIGIFLILWWPTTYIGGS